MQLLEHMVILFLVFLETSILISTIYIPTNKVKGSLFFISLPAFVICVHFDDCHSDKCEMIAHCGLKK